MRWPEFKPNEFESDDPDKQMEEAMEHANQGELGPDDVPKFPDRFAGWFHYGKSRDPKRMRGRILYDFVLRKMQLDYFPGHDRRWTYLFNYQKQARTLHHMIGKLDPTNKAYKRAKAILAKRAEQEANGEELPPLAAGVAALMQEDKLVLENIDYTWKECTSWDLIAPYEKLCPTNCYSKPADIKVDSFPENPNADESSLDPGSGPKLVTIFVGGHFAESIEETPAGEKIRHPSLFVHYTAYRNNTPVIIALGDKVWEFFRWTDMSDWDNFDLAESGVIDALDKPDLPCLYGGGMTIDVETDVQPWVPIPLVKPAGDDDDDEDE